MPASTANSGRVEVRLRQSSARPARSASVPTRNRCAGFPLRHTRPAVGASFRASAISVAHDWIASQSR
jgi:hypothetical protein